MCRVCALGWILDESTTDGPSLDGIGADLFSLVETTFRACRKAGQAYLPEPDITMPARVIPGVVDCPLREQADDAVRGPGRSCQPNKREESIRHTDGHR